MAGLAICEEMIDCQIDEAVKREIGEIIGGLNCPKGFLCAQSGFERLCKARHIGLKSLLLCFDDKAAACDFSLHFGNGHNGSRGHYFCRCPVRIYLATEMTDD